jgi:L-ascorbate metabolism protein UlaG (beta-lactamase superfamily)
MTALEMFETDVIPTSEGDLKIVFLGHGSLFFSFKGMNIFLDPYSKVADYTMLPKADIILITHEHRDHLDLPALEAVRTAKTIVILTEACAKQIAGDLVMQNGEEIAVRGFQVQAVPAYNLVHKRPDGQPFHPKWVGNGYILNFGDQRVYAAGDTENTPEMKALQGISLAFLPMNIPYTMTPEMVADAVKAFRPRILYPYHYGETDPALITALLKDEADIEVRIRKMA